MQKTPDKPKFYSWGVLVGRDLGNTSKRHHPQESLIVVGSMSDRGTLENATVSVEICVALTSFLILLARNRQVSRPL